MRIIGIHTIQLFPPNWDWRRVCEVWVAFYQAAVGVVFWAHPASLRHSSYDHVREIMSLDSWAITLWTVAIAHAICIWANGRYPYRTASMRFIASSLHFAVLLLFGFCFVAVWDFYRVVTTVFMAFSVMACMSIAAEDMARALTRNVR